MSFQWQDKFSGDEIEDFLVDLCVYVPVVAKDLLKMEFGDFAHWFDDSRGDNAQSWHLATCGCLIGQSALSCLKVIPGLKNTVLAKEPPDVDPWDILHLAIVSLYGSRVARRINPLLSATEEFHDRFSRVGAFMGRESQATWLNGRDHASRNHALATYVKYFIYCTLTLLGHKRLPEANWLHETEHVLAVS